jgi:beta-glucanase (GH16 family)
MKSRFSFVWFFIAGACSFAAEPVWRDEFNQPAGTGPDESRWMLDLGASGWGNAELQDYTASRENSFVVADPEASDGHALVLRAVRARDGKITSARLKTQGKFAQLHGRIEARLKLPKGRGFWPAFWMLGESTDRVDWPACGEIDIMEVLGHEPNKLYGTLHGPGYSGKDGPSVSTTLPDKASLSEGYHVYAVDWSSGKIEWSLDGRVYHTRTPKTLPAGTRWVFDDGPFYVLMNLAVGGDWPGSPDSTTVFPQEMRVDYVRVYDQTAPVANDMVSRAYYGAYLEPRIQVLHGAGQDPVGFRDYAAALGPSRQPKIVMTYIGLGKSVAEIKAWGRDLKQQLADAGAADILPQIGVSMVNGNDTGTGIDGAVARGERDSQIAALCEVVQTLGRPVFVRIGYEFEGDWNGYRPESYRAAFIRVTRAFREQHLPVATVWCAAAMSAGDRGMQRLLNYYPGDEWVDWWSLDLFSADEMTRVLPTAFCVAAGQHRRPVMVGESTARYVGVRDGQRSWDKWYAPYFAFIRARPEIKAFCYINWDWAVWSKKLGFTWNDWLDCRIEQNETVKKLYQEEMDRTLYLHAQP